MSPNTGIPWSIPPYKLLPLFCSFLHHGSIEALTEAVPDDATSVTEKVRNYMTLYSPRQPRQRFKQSMELHLMGISSD